MSLDRFLEFALSQASMAVYALLFAVIVDIRTWRRIGQGQYGSLQQLHLAVTTGGLIIASLLGVFTTVSDAMEPRKNQKLLVSVAQHNFVPFLVVLFLCLKLSALASALAPPKRQREKAIPATPAETVTG